MSHSASPGAAGVSSLVRPDHFLNKSDFAARSFAVAPPGVRVPRAPPGPSEVTRCRRGWVWYAGPDRRQESPNLSAFSYFGELLIGERQAATVPGYRVSSGVSKSPSSMYVRGISWQRGGRQPIWNWLLRSDLFRNDFGVLRCERKPQSPFTRDAFAIHFRRSEGPFSGGL